MLLRDVVSGLWSIRKLLLSNYQISYLALRNYTTGLKGEDLANLNVKSANARRENTGSLRFACQNAVTDRLIPLGPKTNYFP